MEAASFHIVLQLQRRRFIAALDERRRKKQQALPGAQARALSRERIISLTHEVEEECYFVLANGIVLKNIAELASCLDQLPIEVFRMHVSDLRNDFARWVLEVFDDPLLSERIQAIKQPRYLQLEIYRYLAAKGPGDPG